MGQRGEHTIPQGASAPLLGLSPWGEKERGKERGSRKGQGERRPLPLVQFGPMGGAPPSLWHASSIPVWPNKAQYFSRRIPVTLRYSEKYPNHSEPFRCPNIAFQYIDLDLSTISRLLVMSPISSGTPNKLRSSNQTTHNTNRHLMLSVRTLRVRELCRHDRDTSQVNNQ